MIEVFSLKTAHNFAGAMASQAELRYRTFVEQQGLEHSHYEGLEYDEFDTPGAHYLVWRDRQAMVRGLFRMLPTTLPYMLQHYWPHMVASGELPKSRRVWEITRVCIDPGYRSGERRRILPELLCGLDEFCELKNITHVVGVTRPHLLKYMVREGAEILGEPHEVDGEMEIAFRVAREFIRPTWAIDRFDLREPVLSLGEIDHVRHAA